jgi:TonB family protein
LLKIAHLHQRANSVTSFDSSSELPVPRLVLEKTGALREFSSSLIAMVHGPSAPKKFPGDLYFKDCWIEQRFPKYAFAVATVLQVLLVLFPPPIWNIHSTHTVSAAPRSEITWYDPAKDFPAILPAIRTPKAASRRDASKALPTRGADAFHPRQTILSEPLHPTHPRQTLIRPTAPQEPPKILTALPNIVQLAGSQPERPKLQLTANELTTLRPKTPAALHSSNVAAPEISALEKQTGAINIASSQAAPKPLLPVNPMSAPRATSRKADATVAAPDFGGRAGENETLIALSATPGPAEPPPAIPAGNLSARVSISPDGPSPGTPGGTGSSTGAGGERAGGGGVHGPDGIFISGGNSANSSSRSGLGIGQGTGNALPSRPISRARVAPENSTSLAEDAGGSVPARSKLGLSPEKVLGSKRVYTLRVNMANMTSASGSWILNFAELNEANTGGYAKTDTQDLAGPSLLKKVDPKYPPELRKFHVDGEVVLYAIIRKDGGVDSIQLVHSVDPQLDSYAMEALAQWKFRPAEKHGEPVDLEAVVHIPFRSRGPGEPGY